MDFKGNGEREESLSPKKIRKELILYLLRKYGNLQTKEVAKIFGLKSQTIRRSLKKLEESGRVKSDKLGNSYIWSADEGEKESLLYF